MAFDPQAQELNEKIRSANPHVFNLLSERGKAIYFPRQGILSQTAEARGKKINATIGTALEDNGIPMILESLDSLLNLKHKEGFSYAPSFGRPEIRKIWKDLMYRKNPSLKGKDFSLPVVTCALTHGLSMAGYLFVNENERVICPDLFWENYQLIFDHAYHGKIDTYPTFVDNCRFNIEGLKDKIQESGIGKKIVILNFPNNPTGYTVTVQEAEEIRKILVEEVDRGSEIVVFIDDAYFGLVFEQGILAESMFSLLADAHERILAVKFDGPTKEDYVWGFRVGFVTFATKLNSGALYSALEEKTAGAIRGNISNASNIAQSLLLAAYSNAAYNDEKAKKYSILKRRYEKIRQLLSRHPEYGDYFYPLPFNSGYFMCVKVKCGDAERVRRVLLDKYDTGIIAQKDVIRIAFSSTPLDTIETLLGNIYQAAKECTR
ncbi:MAG TPA: aminotransferase class I/II-fold pyridoxal phosphate-dependent enzyme [Chitinispirillaceae bacterium]|jgi:aspartate/methionine/tyrosine aminotransferase|nr:aminotransferase class I/II-fold pyridoxal phosphate-dependent enzyme [Chitinispirillaceae bacterium]